MQARILPQLTELAAKSGLPTVATGDVHYLRDTDARAHEALLCIQSGDSLKNPNHWKFETDHFYFKTPQEMALDFPGQDDAMRRTLEVAERCNVEIELDRILLPKFDVPEGRDAFDYLVEQCEKGLEKRYDKVTSELQERLKYELKTIKEMGFTDYFLIVWDFIRFAKQNGVSVGPGRGSSAGSLVAYSLAITDIDPIRYDLMFERFLNPGRKSMPDIDIDFAVEGRERVINYVREKYGADRVAQIITFSTMAARAAVRDAGRVLEVPYGVVDKIAKLIPEGPGQTLDDCLKPGSELRKAIDADPVAKEIIELAQPLEGLTRADSIHAAGVVIGAEPLINVVPLQQKGADQELVTQFSMKDIEALGLLKMDFLGLRNLDVIDKACRLIGNLDISAIPMDDKKTYAMLAKGDAAGVFQFESSGMRDALRQVKPTVFEDLIALVALYRPGPMSYIPSYGKRKAGQEQVTYLDKRLVPILSETHGICVYQEQYMRIARDLAGFSITEADDLRKAIGKKIRALMNSLKDKFLEGCCRAERHAGCREAAVGRRREGRRLLVPEGACSLLRADRLPDRVAAAEPSVRVHGGADQLGDVDEGPRADLRQRVPRARHRGAAARRERVAGRLRGRRGQDPLRPQRGEGRGGGRGTCADHCAHRGRPVRVDLGLRRARRPDGLEQARARGAREVRRAARLAQGQPRGARAGRRLGAEAAGRPARRPGLDLRPRPDRGRRQRRGSTHPVTPSDEYEKNELLRLEKEVLGLYVSEHPLSAIRDQLRRKSDATVAELDRRRDGEVVTIGGIVAGVRHMTTKRGDAMVFLRLEDITGSVETVVFNQTYDKARELCTADRILIVKARIDRKEGETKLVALELTAFEAVPDKREVRLVIDATTAARGTIRELAQLIKDFPGESPVYADLITSQGRKVYAFGPQYKVKPAPDFYAEVKMLLGESAVA